jgi:hypothetical protein
MFKPDDTMMYGERLHGVTEVKKRYIIFGLILGYKPDPMQPETLAGIIMFKNGFYSKSKLAAT